MYKHCSINYYWFELTKETLPWRIEKLNVEVKYYCRTGLYYDSTTGWLILALVPSLWDAT